MSRAHWFASHGTTTVDPKTARIMATSSSAICDGPSSPILTPACDPQSFKSANETADILIWS